MLKKEIFLRDFKKSDTQEVINLLQFISKFEPIQKYDDLYENYASQKNVHSIVAIHKTTVVGYGTILLERKIRGGLMGHIEDIVTSEKYRNKGIGKSIVNKLIDICIKEGGFKVALACKEHNIEFYKKCDLSVTSTYMQKVF